MNADIIRAFIGAESVSLMASGTVSDLERILKQETSFCDAEVRTMAESLSIPANGLQQCEKALEALKTLHETFPTLVLEGTAAGREFTENSLKQAEEAVFTAEGLANPSTSVLIKGSRRSEITSAIFCAMRASLHVPEYFLTAARIFAREKSIGCALLSKLCTIEYNACLARDFNSRNDAAKAATSCAELITRIEDLIGFRAVTAEWKTTDQQQPESQINYSFGFARALPAILELETEMEVIAKSFVPTFETEEIDIPSTSFEDLWNAVGEFPLEEHSFRAVSRDAVVSDGNLLDIKGLLLTRRPFLAACFVAERVTERISHALEQLGGIEPHKAQAIGNHPVSAMASFLVPSEADNNNIAHGQSFEHAPLPPIPIRLKALDDVSMMEKTESLPFLIETTDCLCKGVFSGFEQVAHVLTYFPAAGSLFSSILDGTFGRDLEKILALSRNLRDKYVQILQFHETDHIERRFDVIEGFYSRLALIQKETAEIETEEGRRNNNVFELLCRAVETASDMRSEVEKTRKILLSLKQEVNMSLYVRKGELEQLIIDAHVNALDVYDSDIDKIALQLETHFTEEVKRVDQELRACETKLETLRLRSNEFALLFDEEKARECKEAATKWHATANFVRFAASEMRTDEEITSNALFLQEMRQQIGG